MADEAKPKKQPYKVFISGKDPETHVTSGAKAHSYVEAEDVVVDSEDVNYSDIVKVEKQPPLNSNNE